MSIPSSQFYQSIPPFHDFNRLTDAGLYRRVPGDWTVVLTDVKGSTAAIEAGRYKDVNRVGAAAIASAQKAMDGEDLPYVFGGDGATLLVPPGRLKAVGERLAGLRTLSEQAYGLGLRVGAVPVAEVEALGAPIDVARFELAGGRCIALFMGGGLAAAEKLVKGDEARYAVAGGGGADPAAAMDELSCRWNAVPAPRGRAVSLLVVARGGDPAQVYARVLEGLERVVEHGLDAANPIQRRAMSYRGWWACVRDEARQYPRPWSPACLKKLLGVTVSWASLGLGIKPYFYDPKAYADSIPSHSDYRKFDDTLRMVVDCSPEQVPRLRGFLDGLRAGGEIHYGLHESRETLITCYVQGTDPGQHIHFVDGGDGGYAMAAKQLKAQLKAP